MKKEFEMKENAKAVAEAYAQRVWNDKDLKVIDECVDENVVIHSLLGDYRGAEAMKNVVQAWLKGFPDLEVANQLMVTENDVVSILWRAKGTHLGAFKGKISTGKSVVYDGVTIYRVKEGKITEYWAYLDMQHLLNQL